MRFGFFLTLLIAQAASAQNAKWANSVLGQVSSVNQCQTCRTHPPKTISTTTKMTAYFPKNSAMEGGSLDRFGNPVYTLHQFLDGNAPYVTVAMDKGPSMKAYQKKYFCIPTLEESYAAEIKQWKKTHPAHAQKFKGRIAFRLMDTGGDFKGTGLSRIDICVGYPGKPRESNQLAHDSRLQETAVLQDCEDFFLAR